MSISTTVRFTGFSSGLTRGRLLGYPVGVSVGIVVVGPGRVEISAVASEISASWLDSKGVAGLLEVGRRGRRPSGWVLGASRVGFRRRFPRIRVNLVQFSILPSDFRIFVRLSNGGHEVSGRNLSFGFSTISASKSGWTGSRGWPGGVSGRSRLG